MSPSRWTARTVDVVVIGGGPAGASAARLLARWGLDVVLLTRPAPRPAHGESIPPSGVLLLQRHGLLDAVSGPEFLRATGNTVRWAGTDERVEAFARGTWGLQVARDAFDAALLAAAAEAGVRVRKRATVLSVRRDDDGAEVGYDEGTSRRALRARRVLDCTGRAGLLARGGVRRVEPGLRTMAIVGEWTRQGRWPVPDESHTIVESYADGWAWSVPVSPSRRFVTVMVDPARTAVSGRAMLAETYDSELARTPGLRSIVAGARRVRPPWARDASSYTTVLPVEGGALVVGDAASSIDPLSSFGIKKALASAWLAAVVTRSCLEDAGLAARATELYHSRERAMYASMRARLAELSAEAAGAHVAGFWSDRPDAPDPDERSDLDVVPLRTDPQVLGALEQLRGRASIALRSAPGLRRDTRATVRGERIVLLEHLTVPGLGEPIRYLRNVDLVTLVALAGQHDQVPDLFEAYNRAEAPAPLPDFLGALAVLIAKGVLTFT